MQFIKAKTYLKPLLGVVFLVLFVLILAIPSHAELSVESYCQLVIKSAQQEIENLNELIALAQQYSSDNSEAFLEQEAIKQEKFDKEKKSLFNSFDTTAEEYVTFIGENKETVEKYLNANPEIKQNIDGLSNQVNTLLDQYESLKEGIINAPPFE